MRIFVDTWDILIFYENCLYVEFYEWTMTLSRLITFSGLAMRWRASRAHVSLHASAAIMHHQRTHPRRGTEAVAYELQCLSAS
jgi:hypothetical protein